MANTNTFGVIAEFNTPHDLIEAAKAVRGAGFDKFDTYSPFPIHGMDAAMGMGDSKLGWIVLLCGITGGSGALLMQWWMSAVDYLTIIGGKPFFSYQAFVPITFELTVLLSAFGAVFGMFALNGLPKLHHPLFSYRRFRKATDDGFFLAIESADPKFNAEQATKVLESAGGHHIELVEAL